MACCHGPNFMVPTAAKPKKNTEKRITVMKMFPLKSSELVSFIGVVFLRVYAVFRTVRLLRFVGGKMTSFVFSSL